MTTPILDKDISSINGDIVVNSDAFFNKINNILSTNIESVPFYRVFGNALEQYLFQPFSFSNANLIALEVESCILRFYPDAKVDVTILDLDFDSRKYPISVQISHPKLVEPLTFIKEYTSHV